MGGKSFFVVLRQAQHDRSLKKDGRTAGPELPMSADFRFQII